MTTPVSQTKITTWNINADQWLDLISPNTEMRLLPSTAHNTSPGAVYATLSPKTRFLWVVTDVTAHGGAAVSLTCTISGYDHLSGKTWTLLTGTTIASDTSQVLCVGPGITASAGTVAALPIPATVKIAMVQGNSDSHTYSMSLHTSD